MSQWECVDLFIMWCFGAKLRMAVMSSRLQKLLSKKLFLTHQLWVILTNDMIIKKSIVGPRSSPWKSKLEARIRHDTTHSADIRFNSLSDEIALDWVKRISNFRHGIRCGGVICGASPA